LPKEVHLDIVRDESTIGVDEALIAPAETDKLQEEAEVSQESLIKLSPLTQRGPTSSSGSPEAEVPVVDDVLPRQWYHNCV
jgi:hypothetical protein